MVGKASYIRTVMVSPNGTVSSAMRGRCEMPCCCESCPISAATCAVIGLCSEAEAEVEELDPSMFHDDTLLIDEIDCWFQEDMPTSIMELDNEWHVWWTAVYGGPAPPLQLVLQVFLSEENVGFFQRNLMMYHRLFVEFLPTVDDRRW